MLIPLGFWAAAGAGGGAAAGAYELIATGIGTGSSNQIIFSSLPAGYKHLQLRMVVGSTLGYEQGSSMAIQFNGDTSGNYTFHQMAGNGSGVNASAGTGQDGAYFGYISIPNNPVSVAVIDILDAFSTVKNKTVRNFNGYAWTSQNISLRSNLWSNTAALTQIRVFEANSNNLSTRSRVSLYGIKG